MYVLQITPGKEWLTGHKHLSYMIPLESNTTRLSLYSFVDLTFCITCPAKPIRARTKRRWLLGAASGTAIFVFKVKSRTRAVDWTWHLWSVTYSTRCPHHIHRYNTLFQTISDSRTLQATPRRPTSSIHRDKSTLPRYSLQNRRPIL